MKIAIDIRPLIEKRHTGVQEYLTGLLGQFFKLDKKNEYILFYSGRKKTNPSTTLHLVMRVGNLKIKHFQISNKILNLSLKNFGRPYLDKLIGGADVFFAPNINFIPISEKCRKIITFHDLSFERHPEFFSFKRRLWHKFINPKKQARTADFIIAASESTKADLIELYGIQPDKIKVIYSGINNQKSKIKNQNDNLKIKNIKNKYNLPDKFILYLGTIEPRKNIIGLIKAFEIFKNYFHLTEEKNNKYKLVIAGPKGWLYKNVFRETQKSKYRQDIIFTGFIENKDKPHLYELSDLFVYPSFYEGFGFPPLEAMASGTPTITSNLSSLPEAVGQAAIMVDPYNIDELAEAIKIALTDKALREKLKEEGIERTEKFSWEKCAQETLEILTE